MLGTGFIIGKFRDQHTVVLSEGQVEAVNLSSRLLRGFLGSVESFWTFLDFGYSLLGVTEQCHKVRHTRFLLMFRARGGHFAQLGLTNSEVHRTV